MDIFKKLLNYNIPTHSDDWFLFRTLGLTDDQAAPYGQKAYDGGIGASEIGTILYLTWKYDVCLQKFDQKIGEKAIDKSYDNAAMFFGRRGENDVKELWECWDNTPEGYIEISKKLDLALRNDPVLEYSKIVDQFNIKDYEIWVKSYREKQKNDILFRRADEVKGYLVNPDYRNFFVSLDFWARKGSVNLITGEQSNGFPVEAKTMSTDVARNNGTDYGADYTICDIFFKSYNSGNFILPKSYQAQVQLQMLVSESDYAEIPVKIGSNIFQVNKFERNEPFIQFMLKQGNGFMEKVRWARQAIAVRNEAEKIMDFETAERAQQVINECEPLGNKEVNYPAYVSEKFMEKETPENKILATPDELVLAKQDEIFRNYIKVLDEKRTEILNLFIKKASDGRWDELELPDNMGKVTYKFPRSTSKTRAANVSIKKDFQPNEDLIKKIIEQLPKEY